MMKELIDIMNSYQNIGTKVSADTKEEISINVNMVFKKSKEISSNLPDRDIKPAKRRVSSLNYDPKGN